MENNQETNVAEQEYDPVPNNVRKPPSKERVQVQRTPFHFKEHSNGNILTIHHTLKENQKVLRIVMCVACFDIRGLQLVAIDRRGTIFVFDFLSKHFWQYPQYFLRPSVIVASNKEQGQYLLGSKEGTLVLLDVEMPAFIHTRKISEDVISEITFPGQPLNPKNLALIRSGHSAVLINLESFSCTHRLDFDKLQMSLKFSSYLPLSENILTCFTNDSVHIWSGVSLEVIRIVHPIKLRDKKLHQQEIAKEIIAEFSLNYDHLEGYKANLGFNCKQNLCDGLLASYTYQRDGSSLVFSTWDNFLILLSPYTFELTAVFRLKDFHLVQIAVMTKPNDNLVVGLTNNGLVILLDCANIEYKLIVEMGPARSIATTLDYRYLTICRSSGELAVWSLCRLMQVLKSQRQCMTILRSAFKHTKPLKVPSTGVECRFQDELRKLLTPDRLQQVLHEFHCYPSKYRTLIWCSLLQLPNNKVQYQDLVQMGTPQAVVQRSRSIQLKNETLKRSLIKCWSCLSQWCKVLAYNDALPGLIFPFVKMFQQNPLISFEVCVTLICNQFQLFFEYHPLEPANYLGLCANLLQHYDKTLFDFFTARDVTPTMYAWSVLKNSFSEVLDEEQWMCLWDNILSVPPYFLLFVIVAYNIMQKEVLIRLPDKFIIEQFYHEQNPLDVKKLISKAFKLMEKCPQSLHPKKYVHDFQSIPANVYPKFFNYPKKCLMKYEEKVEDLQKVNSAIDTRMRDLELEELHVLRRLETGLRQEEHSKRMKEVEKHYQDTLKREEERINCQRKMLLLYQKEIRQRKGEVVAVLQETEQRKSMLEKEHELDALQGQIEQERMRNDINLMWAEEELYNHDLELLAQKSNGHYLEPSLSTKYKKEIQRLCQEQKLLNNDLRKITTSNTMPKSKLKSKSSLNHIDNIEQQLDKYQEELLTLTGRKPRK